MDILTFLAENKISEAIKNGDLENLPGSGKPLKMEDLSHVPADLRAGYKILKNANVLPVEMELKKDIVTLQQLIDYCYDAKEKEQLSKRLNEKILRFNMLMDQRKDISPALSFYKEKIYNKLDK